MSKRKYDDDDGRRIADMSGIDGHQPLFMPRLPRRDTPPAEEETQDERPWEKNEISREERRWIINAAIRAALLIAGIFIAVIGLALVAMIVWWNLFQ